MLNSDTTISAKIDWLAVTVNEVKYDLKWDSAREEMKHGLQKYDTGVQYLDGRIELCSSSRKEMKPHVIFSGGTIDRICEHAQQTSFDINRQMSNGKASRIDLAIDVEHGYLDIQALESDFKTLQVITRAEEGLYYAGSRKRGETLYIGSPSAHRRLRIYDKAAERGKDYEWTRIELQLRGHAAAKTAQHLAVTSNPEHDIPRLILDYADWENSRDWRLVMGSGKISVGVTPPAISDREKWLLETVAKSVANEMVANIQGKTFFETFTTAVLYEYAKKHSKILTTNKK